MTNDTQLTLEELIESLGNSLIKEILEGNSIKFKTSKGKKHLANVFAEHADNKGISILYSVLDKDILRDALDNLGQAPSHNNKQKMLTSFRAACEEKGSLDEFFDSLSEDVLEQLGAAMGYQTEGSKQEMIESLLEELTIAGAREMFDGMTKEYLVDCAHQLHTKTTGSKRDVINNILAKAYPQLKSEPSTATTTKKEVKKVPIKKGVTRDDLFQSYYLPELKDYCKKEGLKVSGTRKELADRILKYLEGDTESVKAGHKKKRRKRVDWKPPTFNARRAAPAKSKKRKREEEEDKEQPAKKKSKTTKSTKAGKSAKKS